MKPQEVYGWVRDWLLQEGLVLCHGCTHDVCDMVLTVDTPDEIQRDGKDAIQYGASFTYGNRKGKITWWDVALYRQVDVDHFVANGMYESEAPEIGWEK